MKTVLKRIHGTSTSQFTVHCIMNVSSPLLKLPKVNFPLINRDSTVAHHKYALVYTRSK